MRIALVTDAWAPQVNGVVRTLTTVCGELRRRGHEVEVISPDLYRSLPCPTYPEIRLALADCRMVGQRLERFAPDAIHLSTEGPLGWAARSWCLARRRTFTTAYHTQFPDYLARRTGVSQEVLGTMRWFGLSSICNLVAAIKLARHDNLGPDDVVVTVATDGAALYASELRRYLERRGEGGELTGAMAAELYGRYLAGADTEYVLEATTRERERIFNLSYFTWVEQQGISLADFEQRKSQSFWRGLHDLVPQWDEMITAFNHDTGCA